MENLKKERDQLRRLFNNCSRTLDLALQDKSTSKEQVLASLRQLEDKSQRLFSLDELIREHLFNSNPSEIELQQEFDQIEFYRDQTIKYRSDCEVLIQKIYKQDDQMSQTQTTAGDKNRRNFRLPKLEIKKFDGNVKNWIGFWGQFKKIHEDNKIELEDKFQYLLQATESGSVARNLIESFPPSGSNYQKAVDQMKARFARDEFLIEVYVRELLDLVLKQAIKTKTGMTLANLYDKLETQLRALETLGVTTDKYAAMLYPLVESALPEELLKIWERHRSTNMSNSSTILKPGDVNVKNSSYTNNLSFLLDFIRKEVESEERINLARSSFAVEKHKFHNITKGSQIKQDEREMYSASALYSANKKSFQANMGKEGIRDPAEVKSKERHEEDTIRHFNDTIKVNEQKRYEIQLPWIEGRLKPSSNQHLAEMRLQSTTKKLLNLGKFDEYEKVLDDWERLGIIEEVGKEDDFGKKYLHYLPHHAVIKESSKFTKIRPVFDASAKDESGNSLNSCLETGPNLIELIPSLLLKFRLGIIGVTADIEKAFLQISISPQDRDCLRFLWWLDYTQNKKKIYRHCRVVFGVKPSPFLLSATINYHLQHVPINLKQTAEKLKDSFYVDNCITSVNSYEELEKFVRESKEIMSLGQFNLRDWISNTGNNNQDFENEHISVLGMLWNMRGDNIFCDLDTLTSSQSISRTRRGLLSASQRIFDPIGFTCPFTLIPKLLLQQSWILKIGWDSELPEKLMKDFESWLKQVHFLQFCSIPRSISTRKHFCWDKTSLHTFCDSSQTAYASCVFLRIELDDIVLVQLIQAKSRVAPKNITIPRLELLACLIGVRLHESVRKVLALNKTQSHFWSDSTVALTWIRTNGIWKTFVENRIREINKFTTTDQWRHVPGNMNPADVASRGCSAKCLMESKWWEGPQWLREPQNSWPQSTFDKPQEVDEERRRAIICSVALKEEYLTKNFNYFSKYTRIIRMIAWMLRFFRRISKKGVKINGELVYDEIKEAEICILKMIQRESFEDMKKLKNLQVFRDENDILRVRTRLILSEDPHDFKFPILLPSKHEIVEKLIFEKHKMNSHVGIQTLLCILREEYWVLRGRRTVKRAIANCSICRRFTSKFVDVPLAPLPKERINTTAAFQVTGIDLAGPLFLKGGEKVWIVLYTCAVYRAIHLELVKSLSTDSFILALRRFVARRGRVSVIFSDNGTNMVGANNLLKKVDWNQIAEFSLVKKIKWIFNPPTAAWWGGWWERLVRLVKELLRRNLGRATVNFEEMVTILCDCEVVINSRPLTYVSENEDDLIPLSPSLFIQDLPNSETPDFDDIDRKHLVSRRRYLQRIRDNLRSRFRKEYLAQLVHTGHKKTKLLKIGDVVYVASDNKKRLNWPLGRVLEVIPGKDGIGRVARVKTQQGTILRPLQRLHPLEVSTEEDAKELFNLKKTASKDSDTGNAEPDEEETEDITLIPVTTRSGRVVNAPKRFGFM